MYFRSFSLDNLSLMAIDDRNGFVVDDAIVMIENIAATWRTRIRDGSFAPGAPAKSDLPDFADVS